ncbi:hypothetical protein GX586_01035 [bacterium]|nr:hypothetical protein [bacterium]
MSCICHCISRMAGFHRRAAAAVLALCAAMAVRAQEQEAPSNGTVFALSIEVPSFAAETVLPSPRQLIDPLAAGRMPHWRFRYERGRLVEVSRRDAGGTYRPMALPYYLPPTNGYVFEYAGDDGQPCALVVPSGLRYALSCDSTGRVWRIVSRNDYDERRVPYAEVRVARDAEGSVTSVSFWARSGMPSGDAFGVHARVFSYDTNGYVNGVRLTDAAGGAVSGAVSKEYTRGAHGEWLSIASRAADGALTDDWRGVARHVFAYDRGGQITEAATYTSSGLPRTNVLGVYRIRPQYDVLGNLVGMQGFGTNDVLVFDGPALAPELFNRAWCHAVVAEEKGWLNLPVWTFMDYSELSRAYRRWGHGADRRWRPGPFEIEQLRVLADFLIQAQGGLYALAAAYDCCAGGIATSAAIRQAFLRSGVVPHPASDAGRLWLDEAHAALGSNALYCGGYDFGWQLVEYAARVDGERSDIVAVLLASLSDTTYCGALSRFHGSGLWLPGAEEFRSIIRSYAQAFRQPGVRDDTALDVRPGSVTLRGRRTMQTMTARLLDEVIAGNESRPVFLDAAPPFTDLWRRVTFAGPLLRALPAGAAPEGTNGYARASAYWRSLEQRVRSLRPSQDAWAVRKLFAFCAIAQGDVALAADAGDAARGLYQHAITLAPREPQAYARIVRLLIDRECIADAVAVAGALLAERPDDPLARALREECAATLERHRRIGDIEALVAGGNATVTARIELVELHTRENHRPQARAALAAIAPHCATNAFLLEKLIPLYASLDDLDGVEWCLEKLTLLQPASFNHWLRRAAVAFERREPAAAVACLKRAAEIDRPRLARLLRSSNTIEQLREDENTELLRSIEELIAPASPGVEEGTEEAPDAPEEDAGGLPSVE